MTVRHLAMASVVGAVVALLSDAAFQNAAAAVQSPGAGLLAPWWVVGRVMERSVWVAAALLLWLATPALSRSVADGVPDLGRVAAFRAVGRIMIGAPLVWLVATWLVLAIKITLVSSWGTEGRMFISSYYLSVVLLGYLPWAAAGATLLGLSRHVTDG